MQYLQSLNYELIVVTNQSGIARGFLKWDDYLNVTEKMISLLNKKNTLLAIYSNGLNADAPLYSWRKPNPSMILNAAFSLKIDLTKSIFIGDRLTDLIAGLKSGINQLIHIRTGHGSEEREEVERFFTKNKFPNKLDLKLIDKFNKKSIIDIHKYFKK